MWVKVWRNSRTSCVVLQVILKKKTKKTQSGFIFCEKKKGDIQLIAGEVGCVFRGGSFTRILSGEFSGWNGSNYVLDINVS